MPTKPLLKALTEAGIGSRRRMAEAIKQGKVDVNSVTAESFNHPRRVNVTLFIVWSLVKVYSIKSLRLSTAKPAYMISIPISMNLQKCSSLPVAFPLSTAKC